MWPPPEVEERRLYLVHGARAGVDADGGGLSPASDRGFDAARWIHDPSDLVPSTVADPFAFLRAYPEERDVEGRDDVMTFTGDALGEPMDLVGPVTVTVSVTSDAPSIPIFAKLVDVAGDGSARMLLSGRSLLRDPDGRPTEIYLGDIGYRLRVGHRLRLHVAASDFPLFAWYPGTEEDPWEATKASDRGVGMRTTDPLCSFVSFSILAR
jgi:putative CocE/NonD family hydrolase